MSPTGGIVGGVDASDSPDQKGDPLSDCITRSMSGVVQTSGQKRMNKATD